jgi:hypothetical protein
MYLKVGAGVAQSVVTKLWAGQPGFNSRNERGKDVFLVTTASRPSVGSTQTLIKWVPGVKLPGHEIDHSPPTSAEVKNTWNNNSTPPYVFMAWCLVRNRDNFTTLPSYASKLREPTPR